MLALKVLDPGYPVLVQACKLTAELQNVHYTLHLEHYTLHIVLYTINTKHCTLHTTHSKQNYKNYTLYT